MEFPEHIDRRIRTEQMEAILDQGIHQGFRVAMKDENGETLLHIAVRMKDKEIVRLLLDAGADVNSPDDDGNTPLSNAINTESPELVELLLKHNPNFDMNIIREQFYARLLSNSTDDEEIVKLMVQHGFTVKETDNTNKTMVWAALLLHLEDTAISLIKYKRSFLKTIEIWYQSFLLHIHPFTEHQTGLFNSIIKLFRVFMGEEKVNSTGNRNMDLFNILLSENDIELINVNVTSMEGSFNIDEEADIVVITTNVLLLCYDAENPVCDDKGRTGLHYAALVGNVAVIQSLLNMNLDINATDINGKTPIDYISDLIQEFSDNDSEQIPNNQKRHSEKFSCTFTLFDLKIAAVLFLKHVSKLISANLYVSLGNLKSVKYLLTRMNNDSTVTDYYLSVFSLVEQCEKEIKLLKDKKIGPLSYYEFLTKDQNQTALYTKREEVYEALQLNNNVLREFQTYGPLLQYRFSQSYIRRGLIESTETILFEILNWYQVPIVAVREILSNLTNEELYHIAVEA